MSYCHADWRKSAEFKRGRCLHNDGCRLPVLRTWTLRWRQRPLAPKELNIPVQMCHCDQKCSSSISSLKPRDRSHKVGGAKDPEHVIAPFVAPEGSFDERVVYVIVSLGAPPAFRDLSVGEDFDRSSKQNGLTVKLSSDSVR